MPWGRMQSCSAYAANAIASTWKKNFLQTFFGLQKLWNETSELCLIFFSNWLIPFWNPLLIICRVASFDETDNLPIEFLGCAASNGMPQPSWHNVHIYLRYGATFAARPCCAVPLCGARHSVDVPLALIVYFNSRYLGRLRNCLDTWTDSLGHQTDYLDTWIFKIEGFLKLFTFYTQFLFRSFNLGIFSILWAYI